MDKSSSISTNEIEELIEQLKRQKHRSSTRKNYYSVWKTFNRFFIQLDRRPDSWEDRIVLFAAYLIQQDKKSTTVKSYVSAMKAVLADVNIEINENRFLLNSLTRACRLTRDTYSVRVPIQRRFLESILATTYKHFYDNGQVYLAKLYLTLFSTAYYGLFRMGELTQSEHVVKACDVYIGDNKNKIKFILRSSKTHGRYTFPQIIKISSIASGSEDNLFYCPYHILRTYVAARPVAVNLNENFFRFSDGSPVTSQNFRQTLKEMIQKSGYDASAYSTHSLCAGRAVDLMELGLSVETIKKLGRWTSNAVYTYLK